MPWIIGAAFGFWLLIMLVVTIYLVFLEEDDVPRVHDNDTAGNSTETTGPIRRINRAPYYDGDGGFRGDFIPPHQADEIERWLGNPNIQSGKD